MTNYPNPGIPDPELEEAQKRVRKIRKFYSSLAKWAGISLFMIAIDILTSGGITWSKFPVFFWGMALVMNVFTIIRLQKHDKEWEKRQLEKQLGRALPDDYVPMTDLPREKPEDYSDELLNKKVKQREIADLSEFRKLPRQWKDEDLV